MRQVERTQRSTDALLKASAAVIVEGGLHGLTFDQLASVSGFSRGLVTARFGSKHGLTQALLDHLSQEWSDAVDALMDQEPDGLSCVQACIAAAANLDRGAPLAIWALFFDGAAARSPIHDQVLELYNQLRESLSQVVRLGQRDGSIARLLDPDDEASRLLGQLVGAGFQNMLGAHGAAVQPDPFEAVADAAAARLRSH